MGLGLLCWSGCFSQRSCHKNTKWTSRGSLLIGPPTYIPVFAPHVSPPYLNMDAYPWQLNNGVSCS